MHSSPQFTRRTLLGETYWSAGNYFREKFYGGPISLGGNCPGANCPGGIIQGAIVRGEIIRGAIFLGGNCPRTLGRHFRTYEFTQGFSKCLIVPSGTFRQY